MPRRIPPRPAGPSVWRGGAQPIPGGPSPCGSCSSPRASRSAARRPASQARPRPGRHQQAREWTDDARPRKVTADENVVVTARAAGSTSQGAGRDDRSRGRLRACRPTRRVGRPVTVAGRPGRAPRRDQADATTAGAASGAGRDGGRPRAVPIAAGRAGRLFARTRPSMTRPAKTCQLAVTFSPPVTL